MEVMSRSPGQSDSRLSLCTGRLEEEDVRRFSFSSWTRGWDGAPNQSDWRQQNICEDVVTWSVGWRRRGDERWKINRFGSCGLGRWGDSKIEVRYRGLGRFAAIHSGR
uniref:Uncharacterized protein n=1 Tax=Bionectria ochroleuca TaxID=29856 RepID=A0A8H7KCN3_BIOOC